MDQSKYYALLNEDNKHIHEPRPVAEHTKPKRVVPDVPSTEGIEFTIPPEFLCPISNKVMRDPVTNSVGNTYERYYLEKWLKSYGQTDPVTGAELKHKTLVPHINLQKMIHDLNIFNLEETLRSPKIQLNALVKPVPVVNGGLSELIEQLRKGSAATRRYAAETIATYLQRSVEDRNQIRELKGLEVLVAVIRSNKIFSDSIPAITAPPSRSFAATSTTATVGISPTRSITKPVHIESTGELSETKRYALKALSLAVCNNSVNQEYIRMIDGIYPVISLLRDCPNGNGAEKRKVLDPNRYTNMAVMSSAKGPQILADSQQPHPHPHPHPDPGDMDIETRRYCIIALCNLAQNENNHDIIGKGYGNAMAYFVQCISGSKTDVETKRYGMKAIAYLTKCHPYNQKLTFKSRAIPCILALLCTLPKSVIDDLGYPITMHVDLPLRCKDIETRRFACLALASLCTLNPVICDHMEAYYGIETLLSVCVEYAHAPGLMPGDWVHYQTVPSSSNSREDAATASRAVTTAGRHTEGNHLPELTATGTATGTGTAKTVGVSQCQKSPLAGVGQAVLSQRALDALTVRYATHALAALSGHLPSQCALVAKGGYDVLLPLYATTKDTEVKLNILSFLANVVSDHSANQETFRLWGARTPTAGVATAADSTISGSPAVALLVSSYTETDAIDRHYPEMMRVATKAAVNLIKNNNLKLKYALRQEHIAMHLISLTHDVHTDAATVSLCNTAMDLLQTNSIQEAQFVNFAELDWSESGNPSIL